MARVGLTAVSRNAATVVLSDGHDSGTMLLDTREMFRARHWRPSGAGGVVCTLPDVYASVDTDGVLRVGTLDVCHVADLDAVVFPAAPKAHSAPMSLPPLRRDPSLTLPPRLHWLEGPLGQARRCVHRDFGDRTHDIQTVVEARSLDGTVAFTAHVGAGGTSAVTLAALMAAAGRLSTGAHVGPGYAVDAETMMVRVQGVAVAPLQHLTAVIALLATPGDYTLSYRSVFADPDQLRRREHRLDRCDITRRTRLLGPGAAGRFGAALRNITTASWGNWTRVVE